jgi:hypothetical protein
MDALELTEKERQYLGQTDDGESITKNSTFAYTSCRSWSLNCTYGVVFMFMCPSIAADDARRDGLT